MGSFPKAPLKLIALDEDDLKVISANLQDAVLRMVDMAYVPSEHRFAAILSRFDWLSAVEGEGDPAALHRCRCALRFERVIRAQVQNIQPGEPSQVAELLAVTYEESEAPGGFITLYFAGGGALRLEVECIEAEMRDLGAAWKTAIKPEHGCCDAEPELPATELARNTS